MLFHRLGNLSNGKCILRIPCQLEQGFLPQSHHWPDRSVLEVNPFRVQVRCTSDKLASKAHNGCKHQVSHALVTLRQQSETPARSFLTSLHSRKTSNKVCFLIISSIEEQTHADDNLPTLKIHRMESYSL